MTRLPSADQLFVQPSGAVVAVAQVGNEAWFARVRGPGPASRLTVTRGAVLAGGRGSRLGGAKPTAELAGRPLIAYPLEALTEAGLDPFIVAKPSTDLRGRPLAPTTGLKTTAPRAGGAPGEVEIVAEPEEPTHPLAGIVAALSFSLPLKESRW